MDAELRKKESVLFYSGMALIVFTIWSVTKTIIAGVVNPAELKGLFTDIVGYQERRIYFLIAMVIYAVVVAVEIVFHFYIGISSIKDSRGESKSIVYIIVAFIFLLLNIVVIVYTYFIDRIEHFGMNEFASLIIDATSLYILVEIVISGFQIRSIRKKTA